MRPLVALFAFCALSLQPAQAAPSAQELEILRGRVVNTFHRDGIAHWVTVSHTLTRSGIYFDGFYYVDAGKVWEINLNTHDAGATLFTRRLLEDSFSVVSLRSYGGILLLALQANGKLWAWQPILRKWAKVASNIVKVESFRGDIVALDTRGKLLRFAAQPSSTVSYSNYGITWGIFRRETIYFPVVRINGQELSLRATGLTGVQAIYFEGDELLVHTASRTYRYRDLR